MQPPGGPVKEARSCTAVLMLVRAERFSFCPTMRKALFLPRIAVAKPAWSKMRIASRFVHAGVVDEEALTSCPSWSIQENVSRGSWPGRTPAPAQMDLAARGEALPRRS